MRILMVTNTYLPHVGGVARSVASFTDDYRRAGHQVLVLAPTFPEANGSSDDVLRVPAIQNFNGSDFSVRIPLPGLLSDKLDRFGPDIVHSHHPFLLGDAALRYASTRGVPLVFTHHTMYEQYTHYVPTDLAVIKPYVINLATEFANLCQQVIAPSRSVAEIIRSRGVKSPIGVIPSGVDRQLFARGDGAALRGRLQIPPDALVLGHVGRLAAEKNLSFLAAAAASFLNRQPGSHFLVIGHGPAREDMEAIFAGHQLTDRLHFSGTLEGSALVDGYHAMDVFGFASKSETQGLVLAEAMAAGVPVVALDATGVREVVRDRENGRLLAREDVEDFVGALEWVIGLPAAERERLAAAIEQTAAAFARERCAGRALELYAGLLAEQRAYPADLGPWEQLRKRLQTEWHLLSSKAEAAVHALRKKQENNSETGGAR